MGSVTDDRVASSDGGKADPMPGVLDGLLVLEWAEGVAGPYCGKLLSDFGATVVKIERPHLGDESRGWGPYRDDRPDLDAGGLFLHLNTGKRSVALDLTEEGGCERFLRLFRRCDVLVEDRTAAQKAAFGLDPESLRVENHRAILTSVTPFGQDGPYRDYLADELILDHLSSYAYGTPTRVENSEQHPPLRTGAMDANVLGGTLGAVATLAALFRRDRSGRGGQVDVSSFEALASFNRLNVAFVTYAHTLTSRLAGAMPYSAPSGFLPCKDGHVNVHCANNRHWQRFVEVMGNPDWAETELLATRESRAEYWYAYRSFVDEWAANFTMDELYLLFQTNGVCCFPRADMETVRRNEQLVKRRFFQTVRHPVAGVVVHPGPPFQLSSAPTRLRPAPRLGEHTVEVLAEVESPRQGHPAGGLMTSRWDSVAVKASPSRSAIAPDQGPLAGIRVLDLTWVIAGPSACQLLAQMGAEVIKVETRKAPDHGRVSRPFAESEPGVDTSGFFHSLHAGKRSVAIDISSPSGQHLLDLLAPKCDVIMEGMSWRAARKLGLSYERFSHSRPDLIYLSVAGLGRTEPYGDYLTYGPQLMALAGWNSVTGYAGEEPKEGGGQYTDSYSGVCAAFAVLLALRHRQRTGEGQYIDLSMLECLLGSVSNALMEYELTGKAPAARGNEIPGAAPYDAYPCLGDDKWAAVAVRSDREWRLLCHAVGHPEWCTDQRFETVDRRIEHRAELNALIASWTREREADDVMETLQAAGVPAARTSNAADLLKDKHLRAREFFAARPHPVVGARDLPDLPFRLDGIRAHNNDRAPLLGEHTERVLTGILGLSSEEIAALRGQGVLE